MFLISVLFTLPLPLLASDGVCDSKQFASGCCTGGGPFGQTGKPPAWNTYNPNGGKWFSADVLHGAKDTIYSSKQFVRFEFDDDLRYCGGSNNKVQHGSATVKMEADDETTVRISMAGTAEAQYEKYELFVDGKREAKVQAANIKNGCWVSTCNMCAVNQPEKTFKLAAGPHEIKFTVTSIDPLFHKNCYFQISYEQDGCGGCRCTGAPTRTPTPMPTGTPTKTPTSLPTTATYIFSPTLRPTTFPTKFPTLSPTLSPTNNPTWVPTPPPTEAGVCDPQPPRDPNSAALDCKCKEVKLVVEQIPIIARAYCDKHVPHMMSGQWRETVFCFVEAACAAGKSFVSEDLGNQRVAICELPDKCSYEVPDPEKCACKEVTDVYVFGSNVTTTKENPMGQWLKTADRVNPWQNVNFCVADENSTNCEALEEPDDLPFKIIRGKPTMVMEAHTSATTPLLTAMIMVITYFKY